MAAAAVSSHSGVPLEEGGIKAKLRAQQMRAEHLRAKIMQKRLQVQSLQLQLKAIGVSETGFVPGKVTSGAGVAGAGGQGSHAELRSLLEWLAESADLTRQVNFECGASGAGVVVGGRRVLLQRMAAIPLGAGITGSKLQLSVPLELQAELVALLCSVRQRGGQASEVDLSKVAEHWDMIGAEMVSASTGQQEPAIFLVHRESQELPPAEVEKPVRAIVVAQWPSIDFAKLAAASMFSADKHFQRLAQVPAPPAVQTIASPQASHAALLAAAAAAAAQRARQPREEDEEASSSGSSGSSEAATTARKVNKGDRVVILYRGRWFRGVLQFVDNKSNMANVMCDSDSPGVITVVPLESVWPIAPPAPPAPEAPAERPAESPQRHFFRHSRAKTVG